VADGMQSARVGLCSQNGLSLGSLVVGVADCKVRLTVAGLRNWVGSPTFTSRQTVGRRLVARRSVGTGLA